MTAAKAGAGSKAGEGGTGSGSSFRPNHRFGVLCVLSGALFTSTAGILVRLVEAADGWQLLAYRQVSFVAVLLVMLAVIHGRALPHAFRAVGWPGLLVAVALGTSFCAYVFALRATSVADVVFVLSVSPFVAGLLAWVILREAIGSRLWVAMLGAFAGMVIMVGGGLGAGALEGQLLALLAVCGYAVTLVVFRSRPHVDMLPAVCLAGLVSAFVAVASVHLEGDSLRLSPNDMLIGILLGVFQLGMQYVLVTQGARHISAAEVALLTRVQAILAPLWVWLGVGEIPADTTLIGGAIVLLAVSYHTFGALRSKPVTPEA